MHLVQILLPVADNEGRPFPRALFEGLRRELTERHGGATIFARAPAEGFWENGEGTARDDIVVFEAMCEALDEAWWRDLKGRLEAAFRQDEVVIRAQEVRLL